MKPGHPVILERDRYSPLFAVRCDPAGCAMRRAPPADMSALEAFTKGYCQREGCWVTSAFTLERLEAMVAERQMTVTARRL